MTDGPGSRQFRALGTTVVVMTDDPEKADLALAATRTVVEAVDEACSRFRADSELSRLLHDPGVPTRVSPLLAAALSTAFAAAEATDGLVDPTIAAALRTWGYDVDFAAVPADLPPLTMTLGAVPGWRTVRFDPTTRTVVVPRDVDLDFGATGKGLAADRAAAAAADAAGCPTLVSIGGDIAVAGPERQGGWEVRITDDHRADPTESDGPVVSIRSGGLATSSTTVRRWTRGGTVVHHIIDPRTGHPAETCWRTASVAAATCAEANAASTAAIVLGPEAPEWLGARGLPARLVAVDDRVTSVAGWPADADVTAA